MLIYRVLSFGIKTNKLKPQQYDFLDLVRAPVGSQISITPEEKQKVNLQIDKKLQQLEDTGLSREEILLSKSQKGLPLAIDPFFQYLKRNRVAREIYLGKNDRFTVQKIVDIALRQDIGPDPSYSRTRDNGTINEKGRAELMNNLQEREKNYFDPTSYYSNKDTTVNKLYNQLKPHQPLRHIYKPINRYQRVKSHQRKLKKYDIHWRNVELLSQFLTPFGNIKTRMRNRLSTSDQKHVKMAIKASRHNCAIPHYGRILGANRRNLTSFEEEVKQIGLQSVNLQTGQVYYSRSRSMDSKQVQYDQKNDTDYRYNQMIEGKQYQLWIDSIDHEVDEQIINAERYARILKNQQNQKIKVQKPKSVNLQKLALKQFIGIDEEQEKNKDLELTAQEAAPLKKSFELQKHSLNKTFKQDPLLFSKILFEDKIL